MGLRARGNDGSGKMEASNSWSIESDKFDLDQSSLCVESFSTRYYDIIKPYIVRLFSISVVLHFIEFLSVP